MDELIDNLNKQLEDLTLQKKVSFENGYQQNTTSALSFKNMEKSFNNQINDIENKLNTIVTYIKDGILIVDESGVVKFANPAAAQMFDRRLSSLINQELGLPIVVGKVAELDIIRPHGILGRAEITVGETEWLEQKVSIVALRDVSERNQIEKKLRIAVNKQKKLQTYLKSNKNFFALKNKI